MAMFKAIFLSFLISLLVNVAFYQIYFSSKIATVDVLTITSQFIKEEVEKKHSNQDKQKAIKHFSYRLEKALQQLTKEKSVVLLPKEAVIKGAPDYTSSLIELMGKQV
jgi:Tfp pilus assembly protein PilO